MLEYPETILIEIAAIVFIAKGLNLGLLNRLNPVRDAALAGPLPAPDVAQRFADDVMVERRARRRDPAAWSSVSAEGMVASAHYRATAAGVRILEAGGNAVDAAVAVSAALGVCEPAGSGLGGMTMMMVHLAGAGRTVAIEGPCRAPAAATPEAVLAAKKRYSGYPAVAVPTNAAVLGHALARYGTRRPAEVLAPAIQLAEEGYPLTDFQHEVLEHHSRPLARQGGGRHFLRDGMPLPVGALVRQPELAATLRRLGEAGFEDFYTGAIGRRIVEDMQRQGGFLGEADFAEVPWPQETEPMRSRYRALDVFTLAPPGGGVALLQMLQLHEHLGREGADPDAPDTAILLASIIRRARADRRRHVLALMPGNTTPILLEADHNAAAAREIRTELGGGETTHFVTADRWGNVVSTTQSIERSFGAKVATADLGFLYNGFMKAFKVRNRAHPHFLRPGAVARSNAAPTIVLDGDRPWAALGSTGSERSTSVMFQVLVRLFLQSPFEAVHAPRLHCTPEGLVLLEKERFPVGVVAALEEAGFSLVEEPSYAFKLGGLQLLATGRDGFVGVADPRRDGAAGAPGGSTVPVPVESDD
jgi:gamma-glutamyltranspeptidase/glutathione hydrolase